MKKLTTLALMVILSGKLLLAQTVDEAKQYLSYGRFQSAQQTLERLLANNAKNAEAIYWLGQTHLANENVQAAKEVYQKALNEGVNDPLVWVGMGHVELLQGQKDAARQRFEAAITATTEKRRRETRENPTILTAIGRANADGPSTVGDPVYGIEKLKRAIELDPNNAEAYINLGINYLKLGSERGGDAYEAFTNAIRIDPNNARARFRLGKIFQSQNNQERFLEFYNNAVSADPKFAPAYLELYYYYANRDVNKAREYLEKYIANTDKSCEAEFFYADYLFRAGQYQESLNRAQQLANGICKAYPRINVLFAYNYDRLGDSLKAKQHIETYMATAQPEKIQPADYEFAGRLMLKFPGEEAKATAYLEKAMAADTTTAGRVAYISTISEVFGKAGLYDQQVNWMRRLAQVKPELSNRDLYIYADAAIRADELTLADSLSNAYITRYPDQEYGYSLLVRAAKAADPDSTKGTAIDEVQRYIDWLAAEDATKNASKMKYQYYYIASVYADKLKNYEKALDALRKVKEIDPTDAFANQAIPILEKTLNQRRKS